MLLLEPEQQRCALKSWLTFQQRDKVALPDSLEGIPPRSPCTPLEGGGGVGCGGDFDTPSGPFAHTRQGGSRLLGMTLLPLSHIEFRLLWVDPLSWHDTPPDKRGTCCNESE